MIRNLKVLGLAVVAVLAMSAVVASAASAANFTSTIEGTTYIHGVQAEENVFTVNNRTVKCKGATFTGQASGGSVAELTITPSYTECTAFGIPSQVTMNGCDYDFTASSSTQGSVQVTCPTIEGVKQEITVDVGNDVCKIHIPEQNLGEVVDYTVGGTPSDVLVRSTAENVKTTVTIGSEGSSLLCGVSGERTGKYTGTVTTKGYADEGLTEQVGISID